MHEINTMASQITNVATHVCPDVAVLRGERADRDRLLIARQLDDLLDLHLKFCRRELAADLIREWDLEELVLADKDNMVVPCRVELLRGVCRLGRVPTRVEAESFDERDVTKG